MMETTPAIDPSVVQSMMTDGSAERVDASNVDAFTARAGLSVLVFTGMGKGHAEGHDVAVAVREFVRAYGGAVVAGIVSPEAEDALKARFRVVLFPSLVFVSGGDVLEVLPRVRDWDDYAAAFRRYLGSPGRAGGAMANTAGEPS